VRILTLTHGEHVGPELFADVAAAGGHELQVWDMRTQGPPPAGAAAAAVFGGHQNVGEESQHPWLEDEYTAMREWVDGGVPLFAVCLGAQTLAHALGARVERLDEQLTGFYETRLTDEGASDPVLGALPREFEAFNGNHYACALPDGATPLASGPCLQAFRAGERAWAVQFHPEVKRTNVLEWFDDDAKPGVARQLEEKLPGWLPLGTQLFRAFLREAEKGA
jgi:GMP synthase-like glutamine amidotransferase